VYRYYIDSTYFVPVSVRFDDDPATISATYFKIYDGLFHATNEIPYRSLTDGTYFWIGMHDTSSMTYHVGDALTGDLT
jgi:hypothetical protein